MAPPNALGVEGAPKAPGVDAPNPLDVVLVPNKPPPAGVLGAPNALVVAPPPNGLGAAADAPNPPGALEPKPPEDGTPNALVVGAAPNALDVGVGAPKPPPEEGAPNGDGAAVAPNAPVEAGAPNGDGAAAGAPKPPTPAGAPNALVVAG